MDSWFRSLASAWASRLPVDSRLPFDLALAVLLAGATIVVPLSAEDSDFASSLDRPESPLAWLLVLGAVWAIPIRRILPLTAMFIGGALQMVVWSLGYPDTFLSMAVLLYSAASYGRPGRRALVWAWVVVLPLYTGLGVITAGVPVYALPLVGLFGAAAASLGATTATGRAYAEAAEARARELERSRQADRERALAEERARIARELHDVVAHGLSVIVVQAAAARRILDRDREGAATALNQIETTGRNALGEMRHVLAAIRTEPEDSWQPTRGLADLDALVAELDRAGLAVVVEREHRFDDRVGADDRRPPTPERAPADRSPTGPEPSPADGGPAGPDAASGTESLPATVDVTAYRIVQESLTNVLKHGGEGASARVEIVRRPANLDLRITDDGRGALAADSGGHGLRGMQERVEVFGGRFRAGPRLGGGFTVEVSLPVEERAGTGAGATTGPAPRPR